MSWQALTWATRAGKDYELTPTVRLVLWAMANYAGPKGDDIYPSIDTLRDDTGLSENSIKRAIKHLSFVGILEMGDQRAVDRIPKNRRPTVYRFVYQGRKGDQGGHSGGSSVIPLPDLGGPLRSSRGSNWGATVDPKPVKTKEEPSADTLTECRECGRTHTDEYISPSGLCRDCMPAQVDDSLDAARGRAYREQRRVARLAKEREEQTPALNEAG